MLRRSPRERSGRVAEERRKGRSGVGGLRNGGRSAGGEDPACLDQRGQLACFRRNRVLSRSCLDPKSRSGQSPREPNAIGEDLNPGHATDDAVTLLDERAGARATRSPEVEAVSPAFDDPGASCRASDPDSSLKSDITRPAESRGMTRIPAGIDWICFRTYRCWRGIPLVCPRSSEGDPQSVSMATRRRVRHRPWLQSRPPRCSRPGPESLSFARTLYEVLALRRPRRIGGAGSCGRAAGS